VLIRRNEIRKGSGNTLNSISHIALQSVFFFFVFPGLEYIFNHLVEHITMYICKLQILICVCVVNSFFLFKKANCLVLNVFGDRYKERSHCVAVHITKEVLSLNFKNVTAFEGRFRCMCAFCMPGFFSIR
jgi:hypothetical protein